MAFNPKYFSKISKIYDSRSALINNIKLNDYLKQRIDHIRNRRVVDFGVGTGGFSNLFIQNNKFIVGVDINIEMLMIASKKGIIPICSNLTKLPLLNCVFDVALCRQVIQYLSITEIQNFIQDCYSLLTPNGSLFLHHMVPIDINHSKILKEFMMIKENIHPYIVREQLTDIAKTIGFHIIQDHMQLFYTSETVDAFMAYRGINHQEFCRRVKLISNYGINNISLNGDSIQYSNYYFFLELKK